jgi:hypothetical protein
MFTMDQSIGRARGRDKRVSGHQGPAIIHTGLNLESSYQVTTIYSIWSEYTKFALHWRLICA